MDFKAGYFNALGAPIIGSGDLTLRVQRDADRWFYDFNDNTFKAAGHVTLDLAMAEPDAVRAPGWYWGNIPDVTIALWNDGVYTVYINCAGVASPPPWHDIIEFRIYQGAFSAGVVEMTSIVDGVITVKDSLEVLLAWAGGNETKAGNVITWLDQLGAPKLRRVVTGSGITSTIFP